MYLSSEEFLFGTKCPLLAVNCLLLLSPERPLSVLNGHSKNGYKGDYLKMPVYNIYNRY